jgi:acylphosphatase
MSAKIVHYEIKVRGRVQGVGYRAFAAKNARVLGLKGFVKNLADGSVLVEVEGPNELLDQFVLECKKGPGWAYVDNVVALESTFQGYEGFVVRY